MSTWTAQMLDTGAALGTARTRQLGVRRLTAWLIAVGRLGARRVRSNWDRRR